MTTTTKRQGWEIRFYGRGVEPRFTRRIDDGSYRGCSGEANGETPAVGDYVIYWRCGDDQTRSFDVPEPGGTVQLFSVAWNAPTEFWLGEAKFERVSDAHYTRATAIGDVPDSICSYRRVPAVADTRKWACRTHYCTGENEAAVVDSREAAVEWLRARQDRNHLDDPDRVAFGKNGMTIRPDRIVADLSVRGCVPSHGEAVPVD